MHTTDVVEGSIQGQHNRPQLSSNGGPATTPRWIPPENRYEIMPQVGPIDGETVIHKIASSAFWGTPLLGHLIKNRIDTLVVCGESTSGCVRATVVDADQNQFNVIVVEDCTFDRHEATHAMNFFDMQRKFADVLPLDSVLGFLADFADARTPVAGAVSPTLS